MNPTLQSCLYEGSVHHLRMEPRRHAFRYRLFQVFLDLDELDRVFRDRWLWSTRRPALAWLRRQDHLGDPDRPLKECVASLVEEKTGRRPAGPVRLLTNLRMWGTCFNPVSFFFCYDARGQRLETVVAEVHNTPWGERHPYVLPVDPGAGGAGLLRFRHDKELHVSPFMGMDMEYEFRLAHPGERMRIHILNRREGRPVFSAGLRMRRRPITGRHLARALLAYPFLTARVVAAIYFEALRLYAKGIPFHPHPRHFETKEDQA